jgi:hypothetical protein
MQLSYSMQFLNLFLFANFHVIIINIWSKHVILRNKTMVDTDVPSMEEL